MHGTVVSKEDGTGGLGKSNSGGVDGGGMAAVGGRVSRSRKGAASKYDMIKVKVWLGEDSRDHYYVLSRFLISRTLTVTMVPTSKANKLALETKKLLVDSGRVEISQAEFEETLFGILKAKGFGDEYVRRYRIVNQFFQMRQPLVILIGGAPWTGKSTIAQQLAARLNMPNVLQTGIVYEILHVGGQQHAPLHPQPLCERPGLLPADLVAEFVRECRVVRKGLDGDLSRSLSDGKPLIIEGMHLDPGLLLEELTNLGIILLPEQPQSGGGHEASLARTSLVPQLPPTPAPSSPSRSPQNDAMHSQNGVESELDRGQDAQPAEGYRIAAPLGGGTPMPLPRTRLEAGDGRGAMGVELATGDGEEAGRSLEARSVPSLSLRRAPPLQQPPSMELRSPFEPCAVPTSSQPASPSGPDGEPRPVEPRHLLSEVIRCSSTPDSKPAPSGSGKEELGGGAEEETAAAAGRGEEPTLLVRGSAGPIKWLARLQRQQQWWLGGRRNTTIGGPSDDPGGGPPSAPPVRALIPRSWSTTPVPSLYSPPDAPSPASSSPSAAAKDAAQSRLTDSAQDRSRIFLDPAASRALDATSLSPEPVHHQVQTSPYESGRPSLHPTPESHPVAGICGSNCTPPGSATLQQSSSSSLSRLQSDPSATQQPKASCSLPPNCQPQQAGCTSVGSAGAAADLWGPEGQGSEDVNAASVVAGTGRCAHMGAPEPDSERRGDGGHADAGLLPPSSFPSAALPDSEREQLHKQQEREQQQTGGAPPTLHQALQPLRPLFIPVLLRMSDIDHELMAEDNALASGQPLVRSGGREAAVVRCGQAAACEGPVASSCGSPQSMQLPRGSSAGTAMQGSAAGGGAVHRLHLNEAGKLGQARALQEYLVSYESTGLPILDVQYGDFAATLDTLHAYVLQCIEASVAWMHHVAE